LGICLEKKKWQDTKTKNRIREIRDFLTLISRINADLICVHAGRLRYGRNTRKFYHPRQQFCDLAGTVLCFMAKLPAIMKRWAALTVLLYALALLLLTVPVLLVAFGGWAKNGVTGLQDISKIYLQWGYWLWLAVLVAGQMLLLLLPIGITERRLPARRPLKTPVIVTGFFLANLFIAGLLTILCVAFKEEGVGFFGYFTPFTASQISPSEWDWKTLVGSLITVLAFWFIWAVIFGSFAKTDNPNALLKRITRWLLRGSILELLIAVPSHIYVRRRGDCCAPLGTFWGIVSGISIMLLCFGPGIFFLFVERFKRLKSKQ
jgi:hypothetical protein